MSSTSSSVAKPASERAPRRSFLVRIKGKTFQSYLVRTIVFMVAIVGALAFLLPLVWALSTSLKEPQQINVFPPQWIPSPFRPQNYVDALTQLPFERFFRNSGFVTGMSMIGDIVTSILVAYGFARISFPGRGPLFLILIGTMMLPQQVTMIPVFMMWRIAGGVDTYWPLIVPSFFGSAFYIFLLRQFLLTIPADLEDAARIDGATRLQQLVTIMVPLAKPAIATIAVFSFMAHWQEFFRPLIYLNSRDKLTVPLAIRMFRDEYSGDQWNLIMAVTVVSIIPSLILFFSAQRVFISGIVMSGMKG